MDGIARPRQSGVIPYRLSMGALEILLITSRHGGQWLVPKGNLEPGLSPQESAVLEAYEEAGIVGAIGSAPVGVFRYVKRAAIHVVDLYPMSVSRLLPAWPEAASRKRRWAAPDEAAMLVRLPQLNECILRLAAQIRQAAATNAA